MSPFAVSRELGHGSRAMVEEGYAHLGTMRHRSEVVEFRPWPSAWHGSHL